MSFLMKQITFNGISIQMVEAFSETAFDLTLFTFFFFGWTQAFLQQMNPKALLPHLQSEEALKLENKVCWNFHNEIELENRSLLVKLCVIGARIKIIWILHSNRQAQSISFIVLVPLNEFTVFTVWIFFLRHFSWCTSTSQIKSQYE